MKKFYSTSIIVGLFVINASAAGGLKPLVFEEYKGPGTAAKAAPPGAANAGGTVTTNINGQGAQPAVPARTGLGSTTSNVNTTTAAPVAAGTDVTLNKNIVLAQKIQDVQPQAAIDVRTYKQQVTKIAIKDAPSSADDGGLFVKIAAGSEKKEWLDEAYAKFIAKKMNVINLGSKNVPFEILLNYTGSVSSGEEIAAGNNSGLTVWNPASSAFRNIVNESYSSGAFETEDPIAYSPLVYVVFEDTLDKLKTNISKEINMVTMFSAYRREQAANSGLFSGDPDRLFKFATTSVESNSGLMSLFVAAYDYFNNRRQKVQDLNESYLNNREFQGFLSYLKTRIVSSESSTGRLAARMGNVASMGREFQGALIYENLAITKTLPKLGSASNKARIIYPKYNLLTDHPFYIVRHNTTQNQRMAAHKFLDFLLSKEIQTLAVEKYGFRPASDEVSPASQAATFKKYLDSGLVQDLQAVTNFLPPSSANNLRMIYRLYKDVSYAD